MIVYVTHVQEAGRHEFGDQPPTREV